jgi:ribose/xylose/arabinose/galactoside ABC-type transport system permease subunit
VVIGGTSLLGGVGRITGTVLGVLLIASIRNGLVLLNVSAFWQQVAIGALILLAVSVDYLAKGRPKP